MAEVTLRLPTPLQSFADGAGEIRAEAESLSQLLDQLEERYPPLVQRIRARDGSLRPHVNIFVRRTDVRQLDGLATRLQNGDEVIVMPSVAGG